MKSPIKFALVTLITVLSWETVVVAVMVAVICLGIFFRWLGKRKVMELLISVFGKYRDKKPPESPSDGNE
ncbi:hypothetical protein NHG35_08455 [Aerococcaceae bacterium NML180378]|nr:hypothetical protein [Aerococcaceae bacterium NML180378]